MSGCTEPTVGGIFREYGSAYKDAHSLPLRMLKVMSAIAKCRTAEMGGIKYGCDNDECNHTVICYKPCGDRHCPKCDFLKKEKWLFKRKKNALPTVYYHVVFTIPSELNPIALVNQKIDYDILFKAASETLLDLCDDPNHLGAQIGIIAVLHTWGQNLMDHPHLHCLVPGGGLSRDGQKWLIPKKSKKEKDFFIHVNIISDLFKKKFLSYFKKAFINKDLKFVGKTASFNSIGEFKILLNQLYDKKWVTFCKSAFSGRNKVLEYLGGYAYRVAISNHRIISASDNHVIFKWHDYRDGKDKVMKLDASEFIRRFLMHVLPKGYFKIRYYGLFASRNLKTKLAACKSLLVVAQNKNADEDETLNWRDLMFELTGIDVRRCPKCKMGHLVMIDLVAPVSPP